MTKNHNKRNAFIFLLLLGFVSLLSDFTHEGARSIYGQFLGLLGASAIVISFTSGLGEFLGQTLRIGTGIIADKTKKYWTMMFIGYAVNLLVIPLLMFVNPSIWQVAIILILVERIGKAIRAPAKSALVSFTAPHLGAGKSFAIQEALDQLGAFLGPLFVFAVLSRNEDSALKGYQMAFGLLGIFAILTLVILAYAKFQFPKPDQFETSQKVSTFKGNKNFIIYMMAISFIALGFIDFPVLAFHIEKINVISVIYVPLIYALAMGVDAIAALLFGYLYDKKGIISLVIAVFVSALIAPVFFLVNTLTNIFIAIILWGIGMGAQESILKAVISSVVSKEKRATAYGIFYSVFGTMWFIGSIINGWLYESNVLGLVLFTSIMEILAIGFLIIYRHQSLKEKVDS